MFTRFSNLILQISGSLLLAAIAVVATPVSAQAPPSLQLTQVNATALSRPVYATYAPGAANANNLFVVGQAGNINILNLQSGQITPFLTAADLAATGHAVVGGTSGQNEQGLLGLAFHPNYEQNGRFYVNYVGTGGASGTTYVKSFQASGNVVNVASAATIMSVSQPFSNHNGGWMDFGPDGHMYIAMGDGGSGNDPGNRALNRTELLGKMLRITPGTTNAGGYTIPTDNPYFGHASFRQEIWAYGLRNPWRNSFDRLTGDLIIGDVGQSAREEINFQYANSTGGQNYGWRQFEGNVATGLSGVAGTDPPINPIFQYPRSGGGFTGFSVTGGYVYRGSLQAIQGQYFFADFGSGKIGSFQFDGSDPSAFNGNNVTNFIDWTGLVRDQNGNLLSRNWSSFGQDANGELYAIDFSGNVFRFNAASIPEPATGLLLLGSGMLLMLKRRR